MSACSGCTAKPKLMAGFARRGLGSKAEKDCMSLTPAYRGYQIVGRSLRHAGVFCVAPYPAAFLLAIARYFMDVCNKLLPWSPGTLNPHMLIIARFQCRNYRHH